ncbi:MAG: hypothetical protein ACMVP2_11590 [Imperialibacter sp.]|uniref:hypothetical protein n=1 Tax=Imperialibacter sp. TaxID=2038411 RepID=UPI0030DA5B64|tara:strand:- start:206019 stop:206882 length:864 start_codon:yes stop_codon:yes gene_type:complete
MDTIAWKPLTYQNFEALSVARKQLHQAVQQVSVVGRIYLPKVKDDKHANLVWVPQFQRLAGNWVEGSTKFRVSLDLANLSIHLVDDEVKTIGEYDLKGKTQAQSMVWLEEQLEGLGLDTAQFAINLPYEIPDYPTAHGKPFEQKDARAFEELAWYFHNADHILRPLKREFPQSTDVRCWPHHFDIATLIILNDTGDPETTSSIGIGMSPGDQFYDQPYFYLSPWPYPSRENLTPMSHGKWHEKDWLGAVLTAESLFDIEDPAQQQKRVYAFYKEGLDQLVRQLKPNL